MSNILYSNLPYPIAESIKLIDLAKTYPSGVGMEYFVHTQNSEYMETLKKLAPVSKGLPVTFHGPFTSYEATSPKGTLEYDRLIDAYKTTFDLAGAFDVHSVVFHCTAREISAAEKETLQKINKENITVLLELAAQYGIELLIENLPPKKGGAKLYELDEFFALFKQFPAAGCIIDTGHSNITNWGTTELLSTLQGTIKSYHLHNNDGVKDSHVRILDGTLDMDEFVDCYRKYTPKAECVLEYNNLGEDTLAKIKEDTDWLIAKLFMK